MSHKFWMVIIDGTPSCSHRHFTLEDAKKELERLLTKPENREKGGTILEAVEYCKVEYPPFKWEKIEGTERPLSSEEEYMRRWGVPDYHKIDYTKGNDVCRLCGKRWYQHWEWYCPSEPILKAP